MSRVFLAKYNKIRFFLDIEGLIESSSLKIKTLAFKKSLAGFFLYFATVLFIFPFAIAVLNGQLDLILNPKSLFYYSIYLSIYFFLVGLFLLKNKTSNTKSLEIHKLVGSNTARDLNLENLIDSNLLLLIQKAVFVKSNKSLLYLITGLLLEDNSVQYLLKNRLGISKNKLLSLLNNSRKTQADKFLKNLFTYLLDEFFKLKSSSINTNLLLFVLVKYYYKDLYLKLDFDELDLEGVRTWYKSYSTNQSWNNQPKIKYSNKYLSQFNLESESLFIGREEELSTLNKYFQEFKNIVLVGDLGVGKITLLKSFLRTNLLKKDYSFIKFNLDRLLKDFKDSSQLLSHFKEVATKVLEDANNILIITNAGILLDTDPILTKKVINILESCKGRSFVTLTHEEFYSINLRNTDLDLHIIKIEELASNLKLQIALDITSNLSNEFNIDFSFDFVKKLSKSLNLLELKPHLLQLIRAAKRKSIDFINVNTALELGFATKEITSLGLSLENLKFTNELQDLLLNSLVGQRSAIKDIVLYLKENLNRNKTFINSTIFFLGEDALGKTTTTNLIADKVFGSSKLIVTIDFNNLSTFKEFNEYLKKDFVNEIKKKKLSVVHIKNLHIASAKSLSIILKLLNSRIIEVEGENFNLANNIIICDSKKDLVVDKTYPVVKFKSLSNVEIERVIKLKLLKLKDSMLHKGIDLVYNKSTVDDLLDLVVSKDFGNLKNLEFYLKTKIEDKLLNLTGNKSAEVVLSGLTIQQVVDYKY
jgi:hypothetical protein